MKKPASTRYLNQVVAAIDNSGRFKKHIKSISRSIDKTADNVQVLEKKRLDIENSLKKFYFAITRLNSGNSVTRPRSKTVYFRNKVLLDSGAQDKGRSCFIYSECEKCKEYLRIEISTESGATELALWLLKWGSWRRSINARVRSGVSKGE